jgi:hypothetical protein
MSAAGRVLVRRPPPGGLGDPYPITIFVDGERHAQLMPGDSTTLELAPGLHRLRAHNTLLSRTVQVQAHAGEEQRYVVRNRAGFWTVLVGLLGTGPLSVALDRE